MSEYIRQVNLDHLCHLDLPATSVISNERIKAVLCVEEDLDSQLGALNSSLCPASREFSLPVAFDL